MVVKDYPYIPPRGAAPGDQATDQLGRQRTLVATPLYAKLFGGLPGASEVFPNVEIVAPEGG